MRHYFFFSLAMTLALVSGCDGNGGDTDAGTMDAGGRDAGSIDAGSTLDAGSLADAGPDATLPDAGPARPDAGPPDRDAGGLPDAGARPDAAPPACNPSLGAFCSDTEPCAAALQCDVGRCIPQERPICGGFVGAPCPVDSAYTECLYLPSADFGPCLTPAERDCLCRRYPEFPCG